MSYPMLRAFWIVTALVISCGAAAADEAVIYKEVNSEPISRRSVQERAYLAQPLDRTMNANQIAVSNSISAGRRVGRPLENGGLENQLGIGAGLTQWLTVDAFGSLASSPGATRASYGATARFRVLDQTTNKVANLVLSGGALQEHDGVPVAQVSVAAGRDFGKTNLTLSSLFEKAFAKDRDQADAVVSLGTSYAFTQDVRAGLEAIGEDLEAFFEPEVAEGGARLVAGPSLIIEMLEKKLSLGFNAGAGVAYLPRPTLSGDPQRTEAYVGRARLVYTF
jgi:hypothetical protein